MEQQIILNTEKDRDTDEDSCKIPENDKKTIAEGGQCWSCDTELFVDPEGDPDHFFGRS